MAGKMARVTRSSFRPRIVYRWDRIMHQELKWRMIKRKRKLLILQRDTTREIFSSRRSNLPVVSFVEDREDVEERASREEANQAGTTSWQAAVLKVDCERGRGRYKEGDGRGHFIVNCNLTFSPGIEDASPACNFNPFVVETISSRKRAKPW